MSESNYWDNWWRRRTSRRRMMGGAAMGASGLGAMALVGCGGDDDDDANGGNGNGADDGNGNGNGGDSTPEGGGSPAATGPVGNTQQIEDLTIEEFREMYHGKHLKELPGFQKQPQSGGTFRFSMFRPTTFDPTASAASSLCSYAIFHNSLLRFDIGDHVENHNFTPITTDLAQSMPEQPDELTYTFKLHPGVTFHDTPPVNGRELTAEDVKFAFEVLADSPVQGPTFADVENMDVPDEETIVFKTGIPAAYFINTLVVPYHWIFSREQYEQGPGMDVNPIGTGPFMLDTLSDQAGFTANRNPNYWRTDQHGTQLPYFDRVEYDWIASPVDADAAFRTGELDHRYPPNFSAWQDLIGSNQDVVTQVTIPAPSAQPYIIMDLNKEPFNDVRVRRAMSMAIDRQAMIDTLASGMAGFGMPLDQTVLGHEWPLGPEELGDWYGFDLEQAKQLMADAGYEDGISDTLTVFTSSTSGFWFEVFVAVFNMWQELGITVDHQYSSDYAQWQTRFYNLEYEDMMGVTQVGPGMTLTPIPITRFTRSPRETTSTSTIRSWMNSRWPRGGRWTRSAAPNCSGRSSTSIWTRSTASGSSITTRSTCATPTSRTSPTSMPPGPRSAGAPATWRSAGSTKISGSNPWSDSEFIKRQGRYAKRLPLPATGHIDKVANPYKGGE
ncbi:MAG: ABC transporter substrate-binding protein [Dehalococcoidia bacterium]|nr:ABC transporter substrate-binding protein [Dehalococcoidia bacterium]